MGLDALKRLYASKKRANKNGASTDRLNGSLNGYVNGSGPEGEMKFYVSLWPGLPHQLKLQPVAPRYPSPPKHLSNGSKLPGLRLAILDKCGNILKVRGPASAWARGRVGDWARGCVGAPTQTQHNPT